MEPGPRIFHDFLLISFAAPAQSKANLSGLPPLFTSALSAISTQQACGHQGQTTRHIGRCSAAAGFGQLILGDHAVLYVRFYHPNIACVLLGQRLHKVGVEAGDCILGDEVDITLPRFRLYGQVAERALPVIGCVQFRAGEFFRRCAALCKHLLVLFGQRRAGLVLVPQVCGDRKPPQAHGDRDAEGGIQRGTAVVQRPLLRDLNVQRLLCVGDVVRAGGARQVDGVIVGRGITVRLIVGLAGVAEIEGILCRGVGCVGVRGFFFL